MEATVSRPTGFTSFATAPNNATTVETSANTTTLPSSTTVGNVRTIAISKNKNLTDENYAQSVAAGANSDRMNEIPEGEDSWRAYYEHPLTAATTAMLNINGAGEEQNAGMGLLYEYYKLPPIDKVGDKNHPGLKYAQLTDLWSTPSTAPSSNAVGVDPSASATAASSTPPSANELSPGNAITSGSPVLENGDNGLAGQNVNLPPPPPSEAADVTIYLQNNDSHQRHRRDLTPPPSSSSSSSPPPSTVVAAANVAPGPSLIVPEAIHLGGEAKSREPEDLTNGNRRSPSEITSPLRTSPSLVGTQLVQSQGVVGGKVGVRGAGNQPLVVATVNANTNGPVASGDLQDPNCCGIPVAAVHVKQEPPELDSPGGASSVEGPGPIQSPSTPRTPSTPVAEPDLSKVRQDMAFPVQAFTMATVTYEHVSTNAPQYSVLPAAQPQFTTAGNIRQATPSYAAVTTDYYRDYFNAAAPGTAAASGNANNGTQDHYQAVRQQLSYGDTQENVAFVESGIGEAAITPRDSAGLPQIFDYSDLPPQNQMVATDPNSVVNRVAPANAPGSTRRAWHDFSRSSEAEKVQIPKVFSSVGFRYYLEAPISTSQRREDDRITYINKGQFYGITLEFISDPDKPLKSQTVKSVVLLVFREEKSPEDEMKAWQFWHSRQHSVKQRILDADTKNSSGLVGCIEEVTHNAIAVYWNPMDGPAKINVAVQCLSTDFSNQKGVKGLPLHLQIDTYEDVREPGPPVHRGYCQIKVFCDKGAERKTRDEERRANKRKLTVTGRKKMDELYHPPCDRSEFYSMSDLMKPPMLFSPTDDLDKIASMELSFYNSAEENNSIRTPSSQYCTVASFDDSTVEKKPVIAQEALLEASPEPVFTVPPLKKAKVMPPSDRVMLYIRQEDEEVYTPLHLVPPSLVGLANAIENKYKINASDLKHLHKRSKKGIMVKMDDEMIRHYCNEDTFIINFSKLDDGYEVTLTEL